jgi:hypothetical protein
VGSLVSRLIHMLRVCRLVVVAAMLVVVVTSLRHWLEANMARHMLVEFPLLLCAGAAVGAVRLPRHHARRLSYNQYGLTGFAFLALALGFWMIPAALDTALASPAMAAAKYASLIVAGVVAPASFQSAPLAVQAFFVGNVGWMTATAGLLYQDADRQLCLYYLVEMQSLTGRGLVVVSIAMVVAWCAAVSRRLAVQVAFHSSR